MLRFSTPVVFCRSAGDFLGRYAYHAANRTRLVADTPTQKQSSPAEGRRSVASIEIIVVLPAPLSASRPKTSP